MGAAVCIDFDSDSNCEFLPFVDWKVHLGRFQFSKSKKCKMVQQLWLHNKIVNKKRRDLHSFFS